MACYSRCSNRGALVLQLLPHELRVGSRMTACRVLGFLLKTIP